MCTCVCIYVYIYIYIYVRDFSCERIVAKLPSEIKLVLEVNLEIASLSTYKLPCERIVAKLL